MWQCGAMGAVDFSDDEGVDEVLPDVVGVVGGVGDVGGCFAFGDRWPAGDAAKTRADCGRCRSASRIGTGALDGHNCLPWPALNVTP